MGTNEIILLFPIIFMLHELEEIIFVKSWVEQRRNKPGIKNQYWVKALTKYPLTAAAFSIIIAEEFVIVALLTIASAKWQLYALFAGLLLAYGLHLLKHIGDMVRWRTYVPGGPTSLVTLPVVAWMLYSLLARPDVALWPVLLWGLVLGAALLINLKIMYKVALRIQKNHGAG